MHDFQMDFLASQRRKDLIAEADRARLAEAARQRPEGRQTRSRSRQTRSRNRQAGVAFFLGRVGLA